jgi:hypothetical protein
MTLLTGRLVTDGTGRLFIQPTDDEGEVVSAIHMEAKDGGGVDQLIPGLIEVTWDEDDGDGGYVEVMLGDLSHNKRYEENVVGINGTSGPLFDANGALILSGDSHHDSPVPTDPHYDPDAPNFTKTEMIPDEISATATSHTEAYTK